MKKKTLAKVPPAIRPEPGASRPDSVAAALVVFSLFLLLVATPLLNRSAEPRWDARDLNYPAFAYLSDAIRGGALPMWDPFTHCGYPYHADPLMPTINPVALAIGLLVSDAALGFILFWLFHWWLAGAGMLLLVRHLGGGTAGGLAAALAWAFSGYFVGLPQITPMVVTGAWFPLVVLAAERAVSPFRPGWALLGGCAFGLSLLGGYPGIGTFSGLALAIWLLLRHLPQGDVDAAAAGTHSAGRRASRIAVVLCVIGVVALAIWSPVLSSFFTEGSRYTGRVAPVSPTAVDSFTPQAMLSLFFPFATIAGKDWMGLDITMANGYAGALTIPLALFWFLRAGGKRRPWWLAAFVLFAFVVSLGPAAGLRTLLYYAFPPLRFVRYSSIFRLYWLFGLAVAAGLAVSRLARHPEERPFAARLALGWIGATLLALAVTFVFFDSHGVSAAGLMPRLVLPAAVVLPAGWLLLRFWAGAAAAGFDRFATLLLAALFLVDAGLHVAGNSDTLWVERDSMRQAEAYRRADTGVRGEPGPRHPPMRFGYYNVQQVVKEPMVQGYVAMSSKGFDEGLCKSRFVEVMASPVRYWISPGVEVSLDEETVLSRLSAIGAGMPVPVFVGRNPGGLPRAAAVPGGYGQVRILSYSPERIEMTVEVPGGAGGFLASTDRYAAGWKAFVDGKPVDVEPFNLYFRGIALPPGRHDVRWEYRPRFFEPLLVLSILALTGSFAGGIVWLRRRATADRGAA